MDTNTRRPRRITIFRRAGWLAVAAMVATGLFAAPGAAFAWSPPTITPLCSDVQGQYNWTVTLASGESNYNYQSSTDGTSWSSDISGVSGSNALSTSSATLYVRWSADTNSKTGPVVNTVGRCTTPKITICHATASDTNPYVTETVDEASIENPSGHGSSGVNAGDIIPPFTDGSFSFAGQNWDPNGQAIWSNGCKIPTPPTPVVSISKSNSTDGSVAAGSSVNYTLTLHVTNGPAGATTIVDTLPTGIGSATSITGGGTYDSGTNKITWSLSSVTNGQQLTYTAVVSAGATSAGNPYTNTATISGCAGEGCSASSVVNVQASTPVCTVNCNPVFPTPALTVTKFVSLSQSGPFTQHSVTTTVGTTVWYQVTMTNNGQEPLSGVTFSDSLGLPTSCSSVPTTLDVSATYSCTYSRTATLGTTPNTATGTSSQTGPKFDTATVVGQAGAVEGATSKPGGGVAGATGKPHITPPPTSALGSVPAQPASDTWRIALLGLAALLASLLVFSPKTSPERLRR